VPNARSYLQDNGAMRLLEAAQGVEVTILCVSEVVEDEEELISYLHDRGLTPGTRLALVAGTDDAEPSATVTLEFSEREVVVPARVAHALWVVPKPHNVSE